MTYCYFKEIYPDFALYRKNVKYSLIYKKSTLLFRGKSRMNDWFKIRLVEAMIYNCFENHEQSIQNTNYN